MSERDDFLIKLLMPDDGIIPENFSERERSSIKSMHKFNHAASMIRTENLKKINNEVSASCEIKYEKSGDIVKKILNRHKGIKNILSPCFVRFVNMKAVIRKAVRTAFDEATENNAETVKKVKKTIAEFVRYLRNI